MYLHWISLRSKRVESIDLDTEEYFVSRDVVFHETEFPFAVGNIQPQEPLTVSLPNAICDDDFLVTSMPMDQPDAVSNSDRHSDATGTCCRQGELA